MTLISIAAALIRQAAADENYSQNLHDAVRSDDAAFSGLVHQPVTEAELPWLSPSEWLWFARWRQDLGGPLDALILSHLDFVLETVSRTSRFEIRGLIMRDPASNSAAIEATGHYGSRQDIGLQWAERHAQNFSDSLEVARDAFQYATPAAWFTIRVLRSLDGPQARDVAAWLDERAEERQIDSETRSSWEFS